MGDRGGLARLTEARARQRESLRHAEQDDPYISGKVTSQDHKLTLAAERIAARVGKLEEFADLLGKADAGKHREATLERLGKVDDLLLDLLATTEAGPDELDQTERLRLEVQAVIEQANEAARNLALPDETRRWRQRLTLARPLAPLADRHRCRDRPGGAAAARGRVRASPVPAGTGAR